MKNISLCNKIYFFNCKKFKSKWYH